MFWGKGDTGGYQLGTEKHSWEFPCFFASLYDPSTSSKYQKALKTQCMVHTIFSTTNLPDFMQIKCMNINFFLLAHLIFMNLPRLFITLSLLVKALSYQVLHREVLLTITIQCHEER